jgi:hypothetical protein
MTHHTTSNQDLLNFIRFFLGQSGVGEQLLGEIEEGLNSEHVVSSGGGQCIGEYVTLSFPTPCRSACLHRCTSCEPRLADVSERSYA